MTSNILRLTITFQSSISLPSDLKEIIEGGATDKLKRELKEFLKDHGIQIEHTGDTAYIEEVKG
jgi:hypothetical protein